MQVISVLLKTTESMSEQLYWLRYVLDIEKWVWECQKGQQCNTPQPKPQVPLETIKATCPFEKISWDIMGLLPTCSKGTSTSWLWLTSLLKISVTSKTFSKFCWSLALQSTVTESLATVYLMNLFVSMEYSHAFTVTKEQTWQLK